MGTVKEFLFPWLRLRRIIRELDAEERIGVARMKQELWRRQSEDAIGKFYEPSRFSQKFCKAQVKKEQE